MSWRAPHLLWLLTLVPLLGAGLWWAVIQRRRALLRFAQARLLASLVPALSPGLDDRRQLWRAGLLLGVVSLLLLALAGPQWGLSWETLERRGVDIVIALDTSRSMLAQDIKPNRLERAKLAIEELTRQLRGDRLGLVPFAGSAFIQCPLTLDYGAFAENLRAVEVGIIPKGGTSLAAAIRTGIEAFEGRSGEDAVLLIVTDGEDHEGQVEAAAQQARDTGIRIYPVGIGTPEGELIVVDEDGQSTFVKDRQGRIVKSRLEARGLQDIAITTGGAYIYAAGHSLGLDEVYRRYIARLEGRTLTSSVERRFHQRFQWPLLGALLLLGLETVLPALRPKTTRRDRFATGE